MHVKDRKKQTLWAFFIVLVTTSIMSQEATALAVTTLSAPTIIDTTSTPGTTFSIDITVADVEEMFGFQFILYFDPNVLMAVSYSSYFPFTEEWPSEIGFDYVAVAFGVLLGEPERLTTVDPAPILKIDFAVNAFGASALYLVNTILTRTTPYGGEAIDHRVDEGYFSNLKIASSVDPKTSTGAVGGTFSVNITVAEVNEMGGYQFVLGYDPTVVNATGFTSYPPFTRQGFSEINYEASYVAMNYSAESGDPGLTTVDPVPIAKIDFIINTVGRFPLALHNSTIININGVEILHALYNGYFTNIHDIAVTDVATSVTAAKLGDSVPTNVTVTNEGDFNETFSVNVYYGQFFIGSKTDISLEAGATKILTVNGIIANASKGSHTLTAEAILDGDVDLTNNIVLGSTVRVIGGAYGQVTLLYGLAIGVAVGVVVATGIYTLRSRKKD